MMIFEIKKAYRLRELTREAAFAIIKVMDATASRRVLKKPCSSRAFLILPEE